MFVVRQRPPQKRSSSWTWSIEFDRRTQGEGRPEFQLGAGRLREQLSNGAAPFDVNRIYLRKRPWVLTFVRMTMVFVATLW